jgi:small subunit ribosomal protein S4
MGRYIGPSCKLCRREGMKLFLKGTRCAMAKCPIETGRPVPGMHGQRRGKKLSDYGIQLREKQRLKRMFGLQEEQFRLTFDRAMRKRGVTGEVLLQLLETRLDNVVFKLGLGTSRKGSRLFVTHGHIAVNGRKTDIPSMTLSEGDVITVRSGTKSREFAAASREMSAGREVPEWLSYEEAEFRGTVLRIPTRDDIAPIVNEQLIVELYSK